MVGCIGTWRAVYVSSQTFVVISGNIFASVTESYTKCHFPKHMDWLPSRLSYAIYIYLNVVHHVS